MRPETGHCYGSDATDRIQHLLPAAGRAPRVDCLRAGTRRCLPTRAAGPDLDCSDLPGPVCVGAGDPRRLDRDGEGFGCAWEEPCAIPVRSPLSWRQPAP
ncbi:hypothetical protein GCM10009730_64550 [Streptomyces albidochromogenes]